MAFTNRRYIELVGGSQKSRDTSIEDIIFNGIKIGGVSGRAISIISGHLNFDGSKLTGIAAPTAADDATPKLFVTTLTDALGTAATALTGRVTANESSISSINTAATALTGRVTANESSISSINTAATALTGRVTANESSISSINTAATALTGRVTANESSISSINTSATALAGRVTTAETAATTLAFRVTTAEGTIVLLETASTASSTRAAAIELAASTLTGRVNGNETAISGLNTRLGSAETFISGIDTKIEAVSAGYDPKESVDAATTTALAAVYNNGTSGVGATLTGTANGALTVDGFVPVVGQRILNKITGIESGIYVVTQTGSAGTPFILTRSADFDGSPTFEVTKGARTLVTSGVSQAGTSYFVSNTGTITVGVTPINWSIASGPAPYGTSASGSAGVRGILAADSDKGLLVTDGVISVRLGSDHKFVGGLVVGDYSLLKMNDNAGPITVGQVVILKSNGNVDLATAANATNDVLLGIVDTASIAAGAIGKIALRIGAIVPAYTGLIPGKKVYVHQSTPGELTQTPGDITTGNLYSIGRAVSATEISYFPDHIVEF